MRFTQTPANLSVGDSVIPRWHRSWLAGAAAVIRPRNLFHRAWSDWAMAAMLWAAAASGHAGAQCGTWQPLGSGMSNAVLALTEYNGDLIAGGYFGTAGGQTVNAIARWNGSSWQALGIGMNMWPAYPAVWALTEYNGNLIAGGLFSTAGGQSANNIARWNGSTWQPLGSGMSSPFSSYPAVRALTVYNGELIAGGTFNTAGGQSANKIARWNGSTWQPLGGGLTHETYDYAEVDALIVYNGELIVGGRFTRAGGQPANNIARWNGSTWAPMGSGLGATNVNVEALTVYNGALYAGGLFVPGVWRWNGSTWQPMVGAPGGSAPYFCLAVHNGELIAGGGFTAANGPPNANGIARWNGVAWQPLSSGMPNYVAALTVYNDTLIAGGSFTIAGGQSANRIAAWGGVCDANATFMTVTVHGQIAEAFTGATPVVPLWVNNALDSLAQKAQQISNARQNQNQPPIRFVRVPGDWAALTKPGVESILKSRFLYLGSLSTLPFPVNPNTALTMIDEAARCEADGRRQTSANSRLAAWQIASAINGQVAATRSAFGENHPIYIDIIAHSRGAAVTSRILDHLLATGVLSQNAAVSVTNLDAIDPSINESDLPRPTARAGWLLGDPVICRRGNERLSNFHANYGALVPNYPPPSAGFYPMSYVAWLQFAIGTALTDQFLVNMGYPQGHSRGYLFPNPSPYLIINSQVPVTTHFSLQEQFTSDLPNLPVGASSYPQFSFASTSFLGELIQFPTSDLPPAPGFTGTLPACGLAGFGGGSEPFVADPYFDNMAAIIMGTTTVLADPAVQALLTSDIAYIRANLEQTVANSFAPHNVWQRSGPGVTVGSSAGQSSATIMNDATLFQLLDPDSMSELTLRAEVEFEFLASSGHVTLSLTGDDLSAATTLTAAQYGVGGVHTAQLPAIRAQGVLVNSQDRVDLQGDQVRIRSLTVVPLAPCPADITGDHMVNIDDLLAVIGTWGTCQAPPSLCPSDITGDGQVNINDLLAVIGAWGPCP